MKIVSKIGRRMRKFKKNFSKFFLKNIFTFLDRERRENRKFNLKFPQKTERLLSCGNYALDKANLPPEPAIVYSGGLGGNADFDIAVHDRLNAYVYIFDPTPKSIEFGQKLQNQYKNIFFSPLGFWNEASTLDFYFPAQGGSASACPRHQKSGSSFTGEVDTIPSIMSRFGHEHIDILKLDIEGAAFKALWPMFNANVFPQQIVCEFERPRKTRNEIRDFYENLEELSSYLESKGYEIIYLPREYDYYGVELLFTKSV